MLATFSIHGIDMDDVLGEISGVPLEIDDERPYPIITTSRRVPDDIFLSWIAPNGNNNLMTLREHQIIYGHANVGSDNGVHQSLGVSLGKKSLVKKEGVRPRGRGDVFLYRLGRYVRLAHRSARKNLNKNVEERIGFAFHGTRLHEPSAGLSHVSSPIDIVGNKKDGSSQRVSRGIGKNTGAITVVVEIVFSIDVNNR